jgi:hypothetical protein
MAKRDAGQEAHGIQDQEAHGVQDQEAHGVQGQETRGVQVRKRPASRSGSARRPG